MSKQIGYIGLGKMGFNMVQRLLEKGWEVAATDASETQKSKLKSQNSSATVIDSAAQVVKVLPAPRVVWIMVPHRVVDRVLKEIVPYLETGDIVIDGGNSNYKETIQRARGLAKQGVEFLDVGVSGGPAGARNGVCLMIGGDQKSYARLEELWRDLACESGYAYLGTSGAGHFVKMVHNGIEYGMMQAMAEGFAVMQAKQEFQLDLPAIAELYHHGSVVQSRLTDWLARAYKESGQDLANISSTVAHSGEGQWTVEAAKELGIPVPVIQEALQFRIDSEKKPSYTGKVVSALRNQFGGHEVKK